MPVSARVLAAWSSAAPWTMLEAMLGLFPYAPLEVLFVDPQLPAWLPELSLDGLRVGDSVLSLRFFRRRSGDSAYEVVDARGKVKVVRQPSPWWLTTDVPTRLRDVIASLAA